MLESDELCASRMRTMWNNRRFCDAVVVTGHHRFDVHRSVLAAASPVFCAMLENGVMKESADCIVRIENATPESTETLLKHLYGCEIVTCDYAQVLALGDQYQIPSLIEQCCE